MGSTTTAPNLNKFDALTCRLLDLLPLLVRQLSGEAKLNFYGLAVDDVVVVELHIANLWRYGGGDRGEQLVHHEDGTPLPLRLCTHVSRRSHGSLTRKSEVVGRLSVVSSSPGAAVVCVSASSVR